MRTCLFAGPTLFGEPCPPGIRQFGPAALGSVFRAVEAGYQRVGIVDGYFGNVPSIWHKEILYAIANGVDVAGAASMGALRAAELCGFGMTGVGRIFRLFRGGFWTDDDEVAIIHATQELGYRPLSEALANIRFTLRQLRRRGQLTRAEERNLIAALKRKHFADRTVAGLAEVAEQLIGQTAARNLMERFAESYIDAKKRDAQALVAMLTGPAPARPRQTWRFPATAYWVAQFETNIADVPSLR